MRRALLLSAVLWAGCASDSPTPHDRGTAAGTSSGSTTTGSTTSGSTTSSTGTALPEGCYAAYSRVNNPADWQLLLLPDQPGGVVQQTWEFPGTGDAVWEKVDGLEFFDGRFWLCNRFVIEYDPTVEQWRETPVVCDAFLRVDDELHVAPYGGNTYPWQVFRSAEALRSGEEDLRLDRTEWPFISAATVVDGDVFLAWHNGSSLKRLDDQLGTWRDVPLEGFDSWFKGLSHDLAGSSSLRILDDGRAEADNPDYDAFLWSFDPLTGEQDAEKIVVGNFLETVFGGLWCGTPVIAPGPATAP